MGLDYARAYPGPAAAPEDRRGAHARVAEPSGDPLGARRVQLYNDACIPVAAERHPAALGRTAVENWSEAYETFLGPVLDRVLAGEAVAVDSHAVLLRTSRGKFKERFFSGSFLPVRDGAGGVAGAFHPLGEVTASVRADTELRKREARQAFLLELSDALRAEPDADAVTYRALQALTERLREMLIWSGF